MLVGDQNTSGTAHALVKAPTGRNEKESVCECVRVSIAVVLATREWSFPSEWYRRRHASGCCAMFIEKK